MNTPYAIDLPTLELVIQYSPRIVTADTPVIDVIASLNPVISVDDSLSNNSCVLIVEGTKILGIFTLRDVVKLAALGRNLSGVKIAEVMTQPVITMTLTKGENVMTALLFMRQHQIRHLPVVDAQGTLIGLISQDRIRQIIEPATWLKFRTVAEVMVTTVVYASPTASVLELAAMMSDRSISCVVIVAKNINSHNHNHLLPVGIVTERDIVNLQLQGLDIAKTAAAEVMSQPVFTVNPTTSLWSVQQLMQAQRVRRVVVVGDEGELQGLVTQTNLLQILDPSEILGVMATLEKTVQEQTAQLRVANEQLQQEVKQRQQVEASLQQAEAELEMRVAQRTVELVQVNARLQREIIERQKAEVACQESEQNLQLALSSSKTGIWDWNLKTNEVKWSASMFPLLDVNPQTFDGKFTSLLTLIHPEDREFFQQSMMETINNQTVCDIDFRVVWTDGTVHWANGKGKVFYDETSQPVRMIGTHHDITERKQAQQKIREQAALIDIATDAIFVRDLENQILFWSRGAENLYGWTVEETLGKKADELFCRGLSSQILVAIQATIEKGSWLGELEQVTKTGKKITVGSRWTLLPDESGQTKSILVVNTDITEKKQLEQQFYRAQRLESLGTLASGIAHDLNNVFAPITMIAQLLPDRCKNVDRRTQDLFHTLENSSQRGANLVKQILTFARGTEGKPILLQPGHLLQELVKVIQQTFPKSIEIQTYIPTNTLWMVTADPTQLEQVFMNLAVNARDAMPNGGILTISAKNRIIDETYGRMYLDAHPGQYIVVTIADTGTGIPPELLERVFEPFFTTKELGTGTGLGLSTVLGIVKNYGGFVQVSSQVGRGTQFQVYLPIGEGIASEEEIKTEVPQGKGELILIVDDELVIQELSKETLENYNYKTLVANDGIEAIALYAQYQPDISVVLLDIVMPNMDGLTTIRTLKSMNPKVQIIATSGLPVNRQQALLLGATAFLSKPYTAKDLLTTVSKIL